jgi:tRNA threonylcarbamoyladenosine biosynthesis protein TsaB
MILLLDTSTMTCRLSLVDGDWRYDDEWEAGRGLAKDLLKYLQDALEKNGRTWDDMTGLVAYRGPGSFTGLRIGLTVLNTLADANGLPIVGETGEDWQARGIERLRSGENDRLVMPEYGGEANITAPRK